MSGDGVTTPTTAAGIAVVEEYLAAVEMGLTGPRRWRSEVIAELRDSLAEATATHRTSTKSASEAAKASVAEFGSPGTVVAGFAAVGAANLARRVAAASLASGPVAAVAWVAAMAISGIAPWDAGLAGPWRLLPGLGVVLGIAVPAAILVLAVTGRTGYRSGVDRPRLAPVAAGGATGTCAFGDAVMLAAVGVWMGSTPFRQGGRCSLRRQDSAAFGACWRAGRRGAVSLPGPRLA